jgi:energy-coupling factor transport system permease protein
VPLLRDIAVGRYVAGTGLLHRLDPRTKLLSLVALMVAALASRDVAPVALFTVFVALVALVGRLPLNILLRNLRSFAWLIGVTALLHLFMTPGTTRWVVPHASLVVTDEGLSAAILFSLRLASVVTAASMLTLSTTPIALTDGLESLLKPFRRLGVPAHELAMMVSIALRFIPVLADEAERLQKAQMARGADFTGGPIRRARRLVPLLVPLFLSAFSRADRLAVAMEARGYRGGDGRTRFRPLQMGRADAGAAILVVLAVAGQIWLATQGQP